MAPYTPTEREQPHPLAISNTRPTLTPTKAPTLAPTKARRGHLLEGLSVDLAEDYDGYLYSLRL